MKTPKTLEIEIEGVCPMLMHNGRLADPLDKHTKKLAALTAKRKKTDDDHAEVADAEWEGGLYWSAELGGPYIPSQNIEAMLSESAARDRRKAAALGGIVAEDAPLKYRGPRDIAGLRADPAFRDRALVNVKGARIMRTRPRFQRWSATLKLTLIGDASPDEVRRWCEVAGSQIGIGDYTPKYGRFVVK